MKFLPILAILLLPCSISAQEALPEAPQPKVKRNLAFGVHFMLVPGLNERLEEINHRSILPGYYSFGFGIQYGPGRAFGSTDAVLLWDLHQPVSWQLQTSFHYWLLDGEKTAIAPGVGIGLQWLKLDIERENAAENFTDLIRGSGNVSRLEHLVPMADFSLSFRFKKAERSSRAFAQALSNFRIGYKHGLLANAWKMRAGELVDAPADRLSSFYLQFPF
jgi:hypothetical protein